MGILNGKVALITGAGGGLGRAYALLFAREGAQVVVNDLGGATDGVGAGTAMADQVVQEIRDQGGQAVADYGSVSDPEGAKGMVDAAIESFGRLDIVVNNAGILRDKTLHKLGNEHFDVVLDVHARGTFLVTRYATQIMAELGNGGSVVNTSSIAGLKGNFGQTNYACAKAGIAGMTRVWAQELTRYNIRTNAIAPMAKTRMTEDISAVPDIDPDEIAPVALFLARDLSEDVNGRIFGAHGPHVFEYHMVLSPGIEAEGWTAQSIAERIDEISALPSAESSADEGGAGEDDPAALVDQVFENMPQVFMADKAGSWASVIHFDIGGELSYGVTVADGQMSTAKGRPDSPQCTITYDSITTILDAVSGKISAQQAFMAGKIKADNMGALMKFAGCVDMRKGAEMAAARGAGGGGGQPTVEDQVGEVFRRMPEAFMPEKAGSWTSIIHFDVKGVGSYGIHISDGDCSSSTGRPDDAKCTITYDSSATLLGMVSGEVNAQQAFMAGKIKADNMAELMKFAGCFDMKAGARKAKESAGAGGSAGPKTEGMNRDLIGQAYRASSEFIYPEHAEAYAKATKDLNPAYLEGDDRIAPVILPVRALMGVVGQAVMDRKLNADLMRLVHGEQDMRFHDVFRPWDLVAGRAEIGAIEDKSSGQLLEVHQRLMRDGEAVCEVVSGYFVRGKSKGEKKSEAREPEVAPEREYLFNERMTVDDDQSYRYADISLDKNPIHVDNDAATAAGHPGVIMHGLCTMAMTGAAVIDRACGGDPARLARLKVRFTRIVLPGDTLEVRAWNQGEIEGRQILGVETVNQRGEVVIGNALAEIRPAG